MFLVMKNEPSTSQSETDVASEQSASKSNSKQEEPPRSLLSSILYLLWFAMLIMYHARHLTKKRMSYEVDFFSKSGLGARLEYDDVL